MSLFLSLTALVQLLGIFFHFHCTSLQITLMNLRSIALGYHEVCVICDMACLAYKAQVVDDWKIVKQLILSTLLFIFKYKGKWEDIFKVWNYFYQ